MRALAGTLAVVTGAASGIGGALALRLARERCDLALADIDAAALAAVATEAGAAGVRVTTHQVDVASRAEMTVFRDAVLTAHGRVDLVINNAGVALIGAVAQLSLDDIDWLMGINFWGVVHGTMLFLPHLRERPEAHIVNLSSIFGIIAPPGQSAYCASKFAVRGFSEALRHELAESSVKLSVIHPGGIRTAIAEKARPAAGVGEKQRRQLLARFEAMARTSPEAAAERIVQGILRDEPRILIGGDARFLDRVQRLFPRRYWQVLGRSGALGKR